MRHLEVPAIRLAWNSNPPVEWKRLVLHDTCGGTHTGRPHQGQEIRETVVFKAQHRVFIIERP